MTSKARAGSIPTAEYRCECGGQRHKCDIGRIRELEAEVARLKTRSDNGERIATRATLKVIGLREEVARQRKHIEIMVSALAEIKATDDGNSNQSIAAILKGCQAEIQELGQEVAQHEENK